MDKDFLATLGLFLPLLGIVGVAGWKWVRLSDRDNALFFGFTLLLTSMLYAVVVLNVRITGLDTSVGKVEAAKEDVERIAENTRKVANHVERMAEIVPEVATMALTAAGGAPGSGTTPEQWDRMQELTEELKTITGDLAPLLGEHPQ